MRKKISACFNSNKSVIYPGGLEKTYEDITGINNAIDNELISGGISLFTRSPFILFLES